MANKNPRLILALAFAAFILGAFLLLVRIGVENRQAPKMSYRAATPPPAPARSSWLADLKRGGAAVQKKAAVFFDDFLGGDASSPALPAGADAQRGTAAGPDVDTDAFEKFYQENYARKFEPGGEFYSGRGSERGSWAGSGGGRSFSAGGPSGSGGSGTSAQPPRAVPKTAAAAPAAASPSGPAASASRAPSSGGAAAAPPVFGGPVSAGKGRTKAPPPLFASNPSGKDAPGSGRNHGAPAAPAGGSPASGHGGRAGGISGMSGGSGVRGGAGGGAAESLKAGAESSYNSQVAGGVAAAGAAAASSGGGFGGGGEPGGTGAAGTKTAKQDSGAPGTADKSAAPANDVPAAPPPADSFRAEEEDLLKTIADEKLSGKDEKYVSGDDSRSADTTASLLKPGAIDGDGQNKDVAVSTATDPEKLSALSAERKTELKRRVHRFLNRVEKRYGVMRDIGCISCRTAPDVCDKYGLKGSYLTMKTAQGATLTIGMKYVKNRWRLYTADFKDPSSKPSGSNTK